MECDFTLGRTPDPVALPKNYPFLKMHFKLSKNNFSLLGAGLQKLPRGLRCQMWSALCSRFKNIFLMHQSRSNFPSVSKAKRLSKHVHLSQHKFLNFYFVDIDCHCKVY